jgi:hypothetical protein
MDESGSKSSRAARRCQFRATLLDDAVQSASEIDLFKGNVPAEIEKVKDEPAKDIEMYGCSSVVQTLMKHNLIDEFAFRSIDLPADRRGGAQPASVITYMKSVGSGGGSDLIGRAP